MFRRQSIESLPMYKNKKRVKTYKKKTYQDIMKAN